MQLVKALQLYTAVDFFYHPSKSIMSRATYTSMEELQKMFPDEWILLGNPIVENTHVMGGIPIIHSKNKREVYYLGKDLVNEFHNTTIAYTGEMITSRTLGLIRRL